jgi:hypothetical protein
MMQTLYFVNTIEEVEDRSTSPPTVTQQDRFNFGSKPYHAKYQAKYDAMTRFVSLDKDVGWDEAKLQIVLRRSGIFKGFPLPDAALVRAEFRPGGIDQRIDLLLLSTAGELVACELKIRGDYPDSHGQLLRYVADLTFDPWDLERVRKAHAAYLGTIKDGVASSLTAEQFDNFIKEHCIAASGPLPVRAGGVIIDVDFKDATRAAVRYLNQRGFRIELLRLRARVPDNWTATSDDRWMRLDFETVNP